jgi:predicted transposase/invertase (TIGR01784 family)
MTKLDQLIGKATQEMAPAELWSLFIKYADKTEYRPLLDEITAQREEIKMAADILASISKDETERANYHTRLVLQRDNAHTRAVLHREGREEGLAQGLSQGLSQGRKERNEEIVKQALAMGLPVEQIESLTGISRAEIEGLR